MKGVLTPATSTASARWPRHGVSMRLRPPISAPCRCGGLRRAPGVFHIDIDVVLARRVEQQLQHVEVHLVVEIAKKVSEIANVKIYGHKEMNIEGIDEFYQKNIINPNELKQIYEISDVLLITSYREGFPVVIKEGMANGVVCISTDVGSISEHVLNNKTGFIVENDSEEEIVNKFVKF